MLKAFEHVVLPLYMWPRVWVANIMEPAVRVKRKKGGNPPAGVVTSHNQAESPGHPNNSPIVSQKCGTKFFFMI